ncbi:MAG: hypothetical protein JJU27_15800, partial [Gammaproteobacteria bacterium]|nr:hypothetical protein [Gammaproteobacteria bacterium]
MRNLLLTLLLANLALLAWRYWVDEPVRGEPPQHRGVPQLELAPPSDAVTDSGLAISREADEDDDADVRVDGPPLQLVQQLGPEPRRDRD